MPVFLSDAKKKTLLMKLLLSGILHTLNIAQKESALQNLSFYQLYPYLLVTPPLPA